jgi:cell division protease FtsH
MFLGRDMGHSRDYSEELAEQVDKEVRELIEKAHDEAYQLITENRAVLDRLAAELLEKETLDQNQLAEIFKDVKKLPPRPQWLSSERRPVSDLPAVAVPQPKAPIDAGAVDGGVDSGDGAKPERKRAPRIKPRPATA